MPQWPSQLTQRGQGRPAGSSGQSGPEAEEFRYLAASVWASDPIKCELEGHQYEVVTSRFPRPAASDPLISHPCLRQPKGRGLAWKSTLNHLGPAPGLWCERPCPVGMETPCPVPVVSVSLVCACVFVGLWVVLFF